MFRPSRSLVDKLALLAIFAGIVLALPFTVRAGPVILEWETDAAGTPLPAGTIINNQYSAVGVTISVTGGAGEGIIFDSDNPTGGDPDLGTPNETCAPPGPGIGPGGEVGQPGENCMFHGNLLIIAENLVDSDGDGLVDDPDDNFNGGFINLNFSEGVLIEYVEIIDQEGAETVQVTAYDAGNNPIISVAAAALGDNSYQRIEILAPDTVRLEFDFGASGAIATVAYDTPVVTAISLGSFGTIDGGTAGLILGLVLVIAGATALALVRRRSANLAA